MINRYLLVCCRALWQLLPIEASRQGVEQFLEGLATLEEFHRAEWQAEGAAFFLETFEWEPEEEEPEATREARLRYYADRRARIGELIKDVDAIPVEDMRITVRAKADPAGFSPHQLLADAAYLADGAMTYSMVEHKEVVLRSYPQFLSPSLLRDLVGGSYRPQGPAV